MLRVLFAFATLVPITALMMAAAFLPNPEAALIIGPAIWVAIYLFGYPAWIDRHRPASDIVRLKAYLEANGARVLSVAPAGVQTGGRAGPDWRKYRSQVRLATGEEVTRTIGIEVALLARPGVHDYDHPHRTDYLIT